MANKNKLKISPNETVNFAENKVTSLAKEISSRSRAYNFYSIGMYLPDPDPVLKSQGKDISIYKDFLNDDHVWACVQSRKSGVLSLQWELDRGKAKSRQAKLIADVFKNLDMYDLISQILDAPLWGFQPIEIMWKKTGDYILPSRVEAKPAEWFVFSEENELRFRTKENWNGEQLPDRKFLCPQYNASYDNPYGQRILSKCFWPVTFKKGGLKFWLIFTEKYGMPFLVGRHPRGTKQEEVDDLADKLELMIQDAVAVIPDDDSVELKDFGGRTGSAQIYEKLIKTNEAGISKAILGQTLTTEQGSSGSYALGTVHGNVRQDIVDADKRLVEKTINQLIKWIHEINFASGEVPKFVMWEEEGIDKTLAERDKILTETGVKFTKNYFQEKYGFADTDFDLSDSEPEPEVDFAEQDEITANEKAEQAAIDNALDQISDENLQGFMEQTLKPVFDLFNKTKNYSEAMEQLADIFPKMKTGEMEKLLEQAVFTSDTWGRLNK